MTNLTRARKPEIQLNKPQCYTTKTFGEVFAVF